MSLVEDFGKTRQEVRGDVVAHGVGEAVGEYYADYA